MEDLKEQVEKLRKRVHALSMSLDKIYYRLGGLKK